MTTGVERVRARVRALEVDERVDPWAGVALDLAGRLDAGPGDDAAVRLARELRQCLKALDDRAAGSAGGELEEWLRGLATWIGNRDGCAESDQHRRGVARIGRPAARAGRNHMADAAAELDHDVLGRRIHAWRTRVVPHRLLPLAGDLAGTTGAAHPSRRHRSGTR